MSHVSRLDILNAKLTELTQQQRECRTMIDKNTRAYEQILDAIIQTQQEMLKLLAP